MWLETTVSSRVLWLLIGKKFPNRILQWNLIYIILFPRINAKIYLSQSFYFRKIVTLDCHNIFKSTSLQNSCQNCEVGAFIAEKKAIFFHYRQDHIFLGKMINWDLLCQIFGLMDDKVGGNITHLNTIFNLDINLGT